MKERKREEEASEIRELQRMAAESNREEQKLQQELKKQDKAKKQEKQDQRVSSFFFSFLDFIPF